MYLSELLIVNYKSCQNFRIILNKEKTNILIGVNDCGKSTILKAIGLLLDQKPKFNYSSNEKRKDDISNTRLEKSVFNKFFIERDIPVISYSENECVVAGKFFLEEFDFEKIKNEDCSSHLAWVLENADGNDLWLARVFDGKQLTHYDFILTPDNIEEPKKIYKESSSVLNKIKTSLSITNAEIENENRIGRFKNIELIRVIYKRFEKKLYWVDYKVDKGFFPDYRYLDWNISLEQLAQFTNDLIKNKIEAQINLAIDYATKQAEEAQSILNKELADFTKEFAVDLPSISFVKANILFQVNSVLTDLLINKNNSDGDIHLDSQGDGVKKQLWFALLKWSALNPYESQNSCTKFIWCFDEPETHLYPKAQREFFDIIKGLSHKNVQSIVSTHSTVFIDRADFNSIKKIYLHDGYTSLTECLDIDGVYEALRLKNSDFLFYDKFLVVEGDTEQELIPYLYNLYRGKKLISDHVQIINLGGKGNRKRNQYILKSILTNFKKDIEGSVFYLFDSDAFCDFTEQELKNIDCFFIGKQDIEDSICSTVWCKLINERLGKVVINYSEIEGIKEKIPDARENKKLQANQKFYPSLKAYLATKIGPDDMKKTMPSKGSESGQLIASYINDIELVDPSIRILFDKLSC
ncbi:MAG: AAA family ATPase [Thiolinea sp.]